MTKEVAFIRKKYFLLEINLQEFRNGGRKSLISAKGVGYRMSTREFIRFAPPVKNDTCSRSNLRPTSITANRDRRDCNRCSSSRTRTGPSVLYTVARISSHPSFEFRQRKSEDPFSENIYICTRLSRPPGILSSKRATFHTGGLRLGKLRRYSVTPDVA